MFSFIINWLKSKPVTNTDELPKVVDIANETEIKSEDEIKGEVIKELEIETIQEDKVERAGFPKVERVGELPTVMNSVVPEGIRRSLKEDELKPEEKVKELEIETIPEEEEEDEEEPETKSIVETILSVMFRDENELTESVSESEHDSDSEDESEPEPVKEPEPEPVKEPEPEPVNETEIFEPVKNNKRRYNKKEKNK